MVQLHLYEIGEALVDLSVVIVEGEALAIPLITFVVDEASTLVVRTSRTTSVAVSATETGLMIVAATTAGEMFEEVTEIASSLVEAGTFLFVLVLARTIKLVTTTICLCHQLILW